MTMQPCRSRETRGVAAQPPEATGSENFQGGPSVRREFPLCNVWHSDLTVLNNVNSCTSQPAPSPGRTHRMLCLFTGLEYNSINLMLSPVPTSVHSAGEGYSAAHRTEILEELQTILHSPAFIGSKRSQQFLAYVVENSLAGHCELLKERLLGVTLFGRPAAYETGEDSVVRVAAKEVRQRLGRYYAGLKTPPAAHIDLPLGSYTPVFTFPPFPQPRVAGRTDRFRRWYFCAGLAVGLLLALSVWGARSLRETFLASSLDRFWRPLVNAPSRVLLCVGGVARSSADELLQKPAFKGHESGTENAAYSILGVDPIDSEVTVQLSSFLGQRGKSTTLRTVDAVSFTDLREAPSVMIGAFSNQWTLQMTKELRFVFSRVRGENWSIREQAAPFRSWTLLDQSVVEAPQDRDFALITRFFENGTGQPFVALGGIGSPGTKAAAECLTSSECIDAALVNAPRGWEHKNMQIVLSAKVVAGAPGAPEVLAVYFW